MTDLHNEHFEWDLWDWMCCDEAEPVPLHDPGDNDILYEIPDELEGGPYEALILFSPEEGGYDVEVLGCDGCVSSGRTVAEAEDNIRDALKGWLEVLREQEPERWEQFLAERIRQKAENKKEGE